MYICDMRFKNNMVNIVSFQFTDMKSNSEHGILYRVNEVYMNESTEIVVEGVEYTLSSFGRYLKRNKDSIQNLCCWTDKLDDIKLIRATYLLKPARPIDIKFRECLNFRYRNTSYAKIVRVIELCDIMYAATDVLGIPLIDYYEELNKDGQILQFTTIVGKNVTIEVINKKEFKKLIAKNKFLRS